MRLHMSIQTTFVTEIRSSRALSLMCLFAVLSSGRLLPWLHLIMQLCFSLVLRSVSLASISAECIDALHDSFRLRFKSIS